MNRRSFLLGAAAGLVGCAKEEKRAELAPAHSPVAAPVPVVADDRPVIVAFGDSLTAGYGLDPGQSYADSLQKELDRQGLRFRVVNQGISGDTTDGGVSRTEAAVALKPRVVILELGANDGLRGLPLEASRANLAEMIDAFQKAGANVLLCGMTLPRNYGPDYIHGFERIFSELAKEKKTALMPFFLQDVATNPKLMQRDAMHPTAEGCRRVAANVLPYLKPLLK
ncbi:MAG: arylesterase [Bryobacterales bacterium]|nr:arylesterase [Bryobacterales bacterium]